MLRRRYRRNQKAQIFEASRKNAPTGQIFLEYVIVIGLVVLVMFAMNTLIKRGTQGMIKVVADQIGNQAEADQRFDKGFLVSSYTSSRTTSIKRKTEFIGNTIFVFGDSTMTNTDVLINMGFTATN